MNPKRIGLACVPAIILLGAMSGAFPVTSSQAATISGPQNADLSRIAQQFARQAGNPQGLSGRAVATNRDAANSLATGAQTYSDDSSYLIQVVGNTFTASLAKIPAGQPTPQGKTLWIVVRASDHQVTDWGLGDTEQDLETLGTSVSLDMGDAK